MNDDILPFKLLSSVKLNSMTVCVVFVGDGQVIHSNCHSLLPSSKKLSSMYVWTDSLRCQNITGNIN